MPILCELPDGSWRTGDEIRTGSREWLTGALNAAGVALDHYDRVVIGLLAEDGWSTVQVVTGWIARANSIAGNSRRGNGERAAGRDPPRPPEWMPRHGEM